LRVRIVVFCLFWIALLVCYVILMIPVGRGFAKFLLMGALPDKVDRTDKAKEKFADSLMSVSNTIHSAILLGILVIPLTAFMQAIMSGKDLLPPLLDYLHTAGTGGPMNWHGFLLGILIFVPSSAASYMRKQALNLYDELADRAALSPALRWPPKPLRESTAKTTIRADRQIDQRFECLGNVPERENL
jgi:hypothetical protein